MSFDNLDGESLIIVKDEKEEYAYNLPKDFYEILDGVAKKYGIPTELLLKIIIREEKAVKIGSKRGVRQDLIKIINEYFSEGV